MKAVLVLSELYDVMGDHVALQWPLSLCRFAHVVQTDGHAKGPCIVCVSRFKAQTMKGTKMVERN